MSKTSHEGKIEDVLRRLCAQVNALSEGRIVAKYNALTSVPTTGNYVKGDFVANSAPATAGSAGGVYIITGWICTVSGEPGTFQEARVLTGG